MLNFTIPFLPPSLNSIYKATNLKGGGIRIYKTEEAKRFERNASFFLPKILLKEKVEIYLRFFISTPEKRDLDNLLKLTLDALEGRIIENDSQIWSLTCHKYEVEEPKEERVEIDVIPLTPSKSQNKKKNEKRK